MRLAIAFLGAASLALPAWAGDVSVSGFTNGCFNCQTPPSSSAPQTSALYGLSFNNARFSASSLAGFAAIGGSAVSPPAQNSANLGSIKLTTTSASFNGYTFALRISFDSPQGFDANAGSATHVWAATVSGKVVSTEGGGVILDFDNTPVPFSYSGAGGSGSFLIGVNDVAVAPGQTTAITGQITSAEALSTEPFVCPEAVSVATAAGACSATVDLSALVQNGLSLSVSGAPLASPATFPVGTTHVRAVGAGGSCEFTVTVTDNEAPVPSLKDLPEITGECFAALTPPTATDNCSGTVTGVTQDPLTYSQQGTYTVHWQFADASGNSSSQEQKVVIKDSQAPAANCGATMTLFASEGSASLPDLRSSVSAADNCTPHDQLIIEQTPAPGTALPPGATSVTFKVTDASGNQTTCSRSVTVQSAEPAPPPDPHLPPAVLTSPTGVNSSSGYGGAPPEPAGATQAPAPAPLSAISSVLSIEPGPNWCNFIDACHQNVPYTVKNVVFKKTTPTLVQCSDIFPAFTLYQHGTPNIRTWWPLLYEPPGTTFTLTILYGTPIPAKLKGDNVAGYVHREIWTWEVVSSIVDLRNLLVAFHTLPFGTDEVPLISDEKLYGRLLDILESAEAARQQSDLITASLALGDFELTIADACIAASPRYPNPGGPGTGIAQTRENPACCALAVNAEYILTKGGIGQPAKD